MRKRKSSPGTAFRQPRKRVRAPTGRAAAVARRNIRIGGFMGIENKFVDYELDVTTVDASWSGNELEDGTALSLSSIAQGDGESQRDGRQVQLLSVHLKGWLDMAQTEAVTAPSDGGIARLILVLDKQTNGAQLNAEDVVTVTTNDVNAWRNLQNSQRFRILKDQRFEFKPYGATQEAANLFSGALVRHPFEFHVVFKKPIPVNFSGTTAVVASIVDNSIHLIGCSTAAGTFSCNIAYTSRVRFRG